jgi:L-amino acid N-acyltransferase YncA
MSLSLRSVAHADLPSIMAIYNQAVLKRGLTADLDLIEESQLESRFQDYLSGHYPMLVATENNDIVGWVTLSPYRKGRKALARTTEVSIYIDEHYMSRGLGSQMMEYALALAKELGYRTVIAILIETNKKSVGLVNKYGFELWGLLPDVVEINDNTFNHCIYGRKLD